MTQIVFVRHAETDMAGTFCGHSDPPVNQRGDEQIASLLEREEMRVATAVYSSDLQRARATAQQIADRLALPLSVDAVWREIDFGKWEGLNWAQIKALDDAYARRWAEQFPEMPAPEGEPFSAFKDRVLHAVRAVQQTSRQACVIVVTHGGVMRVVLEELMGVAPAEAWEMTRSYCASFTLATTESREQVAA